MRYLMSFFISLILVAVCVWLFHQLYDTPIVSQSKADEPDIRFIDKQDLALNKACKQANKAFIDYTNHPAVACKSDQDCSYYNLGGCPGNGLAVNQAGLKKLNHLSGEISQNCLYQVHSIPMSVQTIFHSHQAVCQNQQCIVIPQIHSNVLKKQIHDFNRLLKQ